MPPAFSDSGSKPPPIPLLGGLDDVTDVLLETDVALECRPADRGCDRFSAYKIEIGDHDLCRACSVKSFAERPADAIGSAGDNDNLAGNLHRDAPVANKSG